jgi:hypothetical protein
MKENRTNPEETLKSFISSMYNWNTICIELDKIPGEFHKQRDKLLEKLNQVFCEYITKKDRKYAQQLSYSDPPEYNLATNEILSCLIDGKKAFIEVQETVGFKEKIKYTLHQKNDGWRIDKKEAYNEFDNKWEKRIL